MPTISYSSVLQSEYQRLFDTCVINPDKYNVVDQQVEMILNGEDKYMNVEDDTTVPWYVVGILHCMESDCDFTTHLYNGDPLTARTIHEPKGLPKTGTPPFTWEFSAEDALHYDKLDAWHDWSLPGTLYKFEAYNGFGYRYVNPPINSPYLWSFSNHYTSGKYTDDGKYNSDAVSSQCGAAVLLRRMVEKQIVQIGLADRLSLIQQLGTDVKFNPKRYNSKAEELQSLLNLAGAHLKVDGRAGRMTSDAYYSFTNQYLSNDPYAV